VSSADQESEHFYKEEFIVATPIMYFLPYSSADFVFVSIPIKTYRLVFKMVDLIFQE
jgi:hypothetical protein